MPVLPVSYFIQPNSRTCQSTVLTMYASYIEKKRGQPQSKRDVTSIYDTINGGAGRPSKKHNAWDNFHWWLSREFPDMDIAIDKTNDSGIAVDIIRSSIDAGWPVLVSTDQNRSSSGHIVLVIGVMAVVGSQLVEPSRAQISQQLVFVVHDPYGRFGKQFVEQDGGWGDGRFDGASCNVAGDETGPGRAQIYTLDGIHRKGGQFLLIRAKGLAYCAMP